ncbi:MAG TPA: hypothetical protein VG692_09060 [Gemmatimonadales bacterium]|nr:hypothetical protein [Gemmatimonadales bacterium]
MVRLAPALLCLLAGTTAIPLASQTLPARPVPLSEPVRGGTWKDGELVLGRTTLAGAKRMLAATRSAIELGDARKVMENRAWQVGGSVLRPRWQLDPGKGYYELYFDENERLIFALDRTERPDVTRIDLLARYPRALRVQQSDSFDQFQVDVQPCVTLTALVDRKRDHVLQFGYAWTCQTRSLASRLPPADATPGNQR